MNLSNQDKEHLIKNILTDNILIRRIENGLIQVFNAHNTLSEKFEDGYPSTGFNSIWLLLDIDDEQHDLKNKLADAFDRHFEKGLEKEQMITQMAEHILIDWKLILEIDKIDKTPLPKM
ncbi:MAG: hypothetical protein CL868_06500 [Cytophagaceae bacterium]|nr:hypothetical protein [Cytophagaceae bacterium]|tara:strand:+ start:21610 stop:21966 length:357 start_codon:yes stop_codon:yes gene_type:complete